MQIMAVFIPTSTGHKHFRKCVRFIEQYMFIVGKNRVSNAVGPTDVIANILRAHIEERFRFISTQNSSEQEGKQEERLLQDASRDPSQAKLSTPMPTIATQQAEIDIINGTIPSNQQIMDTSSQNYDAKPGGLQQNVPKADTEDPKQSPQVLHRRASLEEHTWEYLVYEADEEEWLEWQAELQQVINNLLSRYKVLPLSVPKVVSGWKRVNYELDDNRNHAKLGGFPGWEESMLPEPPACYQPQPERKHSSFTPPPPPDNHSSLSQSSSHPYFGPHFEIPRIDITNTDQHDARVDSSSRNDEGSSGINDEAENE
jgi:hypothetical protein